MKIFQKLFLLMLITEITTRRNNKPINRKLSGMWNISNEEEEGMGDALDTSKSILINLQRKQNDNIKVYEGWMNQISDQLSDLRDSVGKTANDMAIGIQRRNLLLSHMNNQGNRNMI
jgi:hypothetical protein